ncbi:hypothetical protein D3C83_142190 [compost metagenome]
MALEERSIIHPIEMVAAQDEERIYPPIPQVGQHLSDRVGGALEPLFAVPCLFCRKDLHEPG